ncbi:tyrosine-protein kinase hopscotch [Ceratitis capitata]|uniref:non-specific protein-tyrosine kinase n=1 Tax=Ceratitis capitata TaxID=7213 RepID=W8BGB9_CERCA|nr:tyrosine-protein kinase hopscotch [Ceratitis capitata]
MIRLLGEKLEVSQWIMNQASNTSGTTNTTITLLDTNSASFSMGGRSSIHSNGSISNSDHTDISSATMPTQTLLKIFNYKDNIDNEFSNLTLCEDICLSISRQLKILPTTRLLFGLRVMDSGNEWAAPGHELRPGVRYCFRMRFKVPNMDTQLKNLDKQAYEYLYWQIRHDILHEKIPEIRHPERKDNVMGFAVMHMCIDLQSKSSEGERLASNYRREVIENIENKYKEYLPHTLLREHRYFVKSKIRATFKSVRDKKIGFTEFKFYYIDEVCKLAPNYLMEFYFVAVEYIPNDDPISVQATTGKMGNNSGIQRVYAKLDTHDHPEPGLKISLKKDNWTLLAKLEDIYAIYIKNEVEAYLEIIELPRSYFMQFSSKYELESFVTYIGGYLRLTSKWSKDICNDFPTPSLKFLRETKCHGPIGGAYSFDKLRKMSEKRPTCIIRQCEKEYDVYFVDINTQRSVKGRFAGNIVTTKITFQNKKWILHSTEGLKEYESLKDLKNSISTEMLCIPQSEYEQAPLLHICLPKNLHPKEADTELSKSVLQKGKVQIFDRGNDLRWYENTQRSADNGKIIIMQGDWVQQPAYKDVKVTLKIFSEESDLKDFTSLTHFCNQIYSAQFLKLYGVTLTRPYTMAMEYAHYGPLDKLLRKNKNKISFSMLIDIAFDLVRGIGYLREKKFYHGSIRCSNMFVTKFDANNNKIQTKIGDPGLRRPYTYEDLPWIPQEYYNNLNAVHGDNCVDAWAFATTLWEIFAYGKSPLEELGCGGNIHEMGEKLQTNRTQRYGGILPQPSKDCPDKIYHIMLDGWQTDAHRRFDCVDIFGILQHFEKRLPVYESDSDFYDHNENNEDDDVSLNYSEAPSSPQNHNRFDDVIMSVVIQLPNGKVIVDKRLGEGHYGVVYSGTINCKNKPIEKVAVKTLKTTANVKDFIRESKIMTGLEHENVVKIKCFVEKPIFYIIMEYVSGGSFNDFLIAQKQDLTNRMLLHYAHDIAKGMNYLAEKKIIHRDLATRNILIESDRLKISDFGLAQFANSDGYYIVQSRRDIPIKWYSPEAILYNKFSVYTDVWSFGVTMFETFSRGGEPNLIDNRELSKDEFLSQLQSGKRLKKPEGCPQIVYDKLMRECWREEPRMRPNFAELLVSIRSIMEEQGETI